MEGVTESKTEMRGSHLQLGAPTAANSNNADESSRLNGWCSHSFRNRLAQMQGNKNLCASSTCFPAGVRAFHRQCSYGRLDGWLAGCSCVVSFTVMRSSKLARAVVDLLHRRRLIISVDIRRKSFRLHEQCSRVHK